MPRTPEMMLHVGEEHFGFKVVNATPLGEMFMLVYELEHGRSGARLLHFHCEDGENLFSINFPTPPGDDTGLPHIMEHSVLSGSRRFPVRDPFFEMYKMSMATFINAMTGADCTYYPVCSNVKRDLFNLAEVYFDAVFHPLLTRDTFDREAYHLRLADDGGENSKLIFNGVVYNEMRAAFSVPETRLQRLATQRLFPDTCYGRESGGDPVAIPDLTYEDFLAFHRHWYHPSNARLVCYGDIPTADYLRFLEPRLAGFERSQIEPRFGGQPRWGAPVELFETYDIGEGETSAATFIQMSWITPGPLELEKSIYLEIVAKVLLGDDAAPLRKAIVDSGIGQDLLPSGAAGVGLEGMFQVGVRGAEPERLAAFRELVLNELRRAVSDGIPNNLVESAFRRYIHEVRAVRRNQPLNVASQALATWIHGGAPLLHLAIGEALEKCREHCLRDSSLLSQLIERELLDNKHRLDVVMAPDRGWRARQEAVERSRLEVIEKTLAADGRRAVAARAEELRQAAGVANSPEVLAKLPQLSRGDLPAEPSRIPREETRLSTGNLFIRNDVFANGINYLEIHVDLEGLPSGLWPRLPRYVETIRKLGAAGVGYEEMARSVAAATGGFECGARFTGHATEPEAVRKGLIFKLKALDEQVDEALEVLRGKLFEPDPDDRARFRDVVTQELSRRRSALVNGGPGTALTQLGAFMGELGYLRELCGGLSQFHQVRSLGGDFDGNFPAALEAVMTIAKFVLNRRRFSIGFTGGDAAAEKVKSALGDWLAAMPDEPFLAVPTGFTASNAIPPRLGFAAPTAVAHCAQALPAPHVSHPDSPMLDLAMVMLRVDYMVSELRFKGNAYGASCGYDGHSITLSTYADPHIKRTLEVFAALPEYVRSVPWGEVELTRGVINAARNMVKPIRPEEATSATLAARVVGETDELRRRRYQAWLEATPEKVRQATLAVLERGFPQAPLAVVSNRAKLEAANLELGGGALAISDILG